MGENEQGKVNNALPGLPVDIFEAAVQSLVELRDSGKYMVFLARQSSVKLVGEPEEFRRTLAERLAQEVSEDEAKKALAEMRNFCKAQTYFEAADRTVRFLEDNIYDDQFEAVGEEGKKGFREHLHAKVRLVSAHLYSDAIKQRSRRMETATAPCLEDLDVELVSKRHGDLRGSNVEQPFLRLRLRYSEGTRPQFPFAFAAPWGDVGPFSLPSFELECDESDIDLLIYRLTAAKKVLLTSEDAAQAEDND